MRRHAVGEALSPDVPGAAAWRGRKVVEIGAGSAIPSVRRFGERLVGERRCHLIRINVREPDASGFGDIGLSLKEIDELSAIGELVVFR